MKNVLSIFVFLFIIYGAFDVDPDGIKTVKEGDSLTLRTDFIEMQNDGIIEWKVNGTRIATINKGNGKVEYNDVKLMVMFSDRLNLDQTGFLTIWNIRLKHSGEYKVEGSSSVGTTSKTFKVIVKESPLKTVEDKDEIKTLSVKRGNSETLQTDTELQKHDLILWRFGAEGYLIAKGDIEDSQILYYDGADRRFRDRLKMDSKTGSLTITDINTEHGGEYQLKIICERRISFKRFTVTVSISDMSPGAVAGIVVVVLLLAAATAGVIYWHLKNSELKKIKNLLKQLDQLLKISKQLEYLSAISEQSSKISGKELQKSSKKEILKLSEKLKTMSEISEKELMKISEQVEQMREDEFSGRLLEISEKLKKMFMTNEAKISEQEMLMTNEAKISEQEMPDATKEERTSSEMEENEGCIYVQETAVSQAIGGISGANVRFHPKIGESLVIGKESVKTTPAGGEDEFSGQLFMTNEAKISEQEMLMTNEAKISEQEMREDEFSGQPFMTNEAKISEQEMREDEFSGQLFMTNEAKISEQEMPDATKEERTRSEMEENEGCIYVQETAISKAIGGTRGVNVGFNPKIRKSLVIRKEPGAKGAKTDGNVPGNEPKDLKADSTEKGVNDETPLMSQNKDDGVNDQ